MNFENDITTKSRMLAMDAVHAPDFEKALGLVLSSERSFLTDLNAFIDEYNTLKQEIDESIVGSHTVKAHIAQFPSFGEFYCTGFLSLFPSSYCYRTPNESQSKTEMSFADGLLKSMTSRFKPKGPGKKTDGGLSNIIQGETLIEVLENPQKDEISYDIKQYDMFRLLLSNLGILTAENRNEAKDFVIRSSHIFLETFAQNWISKDIHISPKRVKIYAPHALAIFLSISFVKTQLDILKRIDEINTSRKQESVDGLNNKPLIEYDHPNRKCGYKISNVNVDIKGDRVVIDFAEVSIPRKLTSVAYDEFEGLGNFPLCILQHVAQKYEGHCTLESFDFDMQISFVNNAHKTSPGCITWGTRITFDSTLIGHALSEK